MANKNNRLKSIAQAQKQNAVALTTFEKFVLNADRSQAQEQPHVNLKYFHSEYQCFSEWSSQELKSLSSFIRKLGGQKWADIYKTGGSLGHKTGVGYTPHKDRSKLPKHSVLDTVSEDITFFELRVDGEMRVHGFRVMDAFYLVWLDRAHAVYPG